MRSAGASSIKACKPMCRVLLLAFKQVAATTRSFALTPSIRPLDMTRRKPPPPRARDAAAAEVAVGELLCIPVGYCCAVAALPVQGTTRYRCAIGNECMNGAPVAPQAANTAGLALAAMLGGGTYMMATRTISSTRDSNRRAIRINRGLALYGRGQVNTCTMETLAPAPYFRHRVRICSWLCSR